jgi:two-component system CheB/CheR fusion protein
MPDEEDDSTTPDAHSQARPEPVEEPGQPLTQREPAATGGGNGDGNGEGEHVGSGGGNGDVTAGVQPDRLAQPVDVEQPPRLGFPVVGIGASAGGIEAFGEFFKVMPADAGMAFVVILHLPPDRESLLSDILSKRTRMPVAEVKDGQAVEADHVYVIAPGRTVTIRDGRLHLSEPVEKRGHQRPVDDFFRSLAAEQRERAICISMSGMGSNGAAGAQAVKAVGGVCIAQDPESAKFNQMPRAMIDTGLADFVLRAEEMPEVLMRYATHPYARGESARAAEAGAADAQEAARVERQHLMEVLSILRTRTRRDFSGYKRPTVMRRIQRRMGLNHVTRLAEYGRLLRQNPAETMALADDLMIHVTGFFRDAEAWEALRRQVIVPLIDRREPDASIRAWVTACSSGEEAYTLAILLLEAAEAAGKPLDIKVFATDMAERALNLARAGVYPLGIEGEVPPERLDRYFQREEAAYRVKPLVREMVVFAPQNVLQDPPFSRLDLISCRNLMIYLEPAMQERVLKLLHFGLREGGTLFLGTSETVGNLSGLFETVDKRWRIYRRVGPTRPGMVTFPMSVRSVGGAEGDAGTEAASSVDAGGPAAWGGVRPTVATMTQRALLERYTPAAVVVDREQRVVYFHGKTDRFLTQPAGEPTRDLLMLAREDVRGALRAALHKSVSEGVTVKAPDGLSETQAGQVRTIVSVSPLDPRLAPGYFLVSFEERPEPVTPQDPAVAKLDDPHRLVLEAELRRVREELQSSIEELQTSNEELKASNEEVTSVNEELQSANEELETSKEELQSLNEEMATVNTQLHGKAEELEGTTNDLTSLLTSSDIAVLFLDTDFRIRRYTPAVSDLLEMIPGDLGRPLSDLRLKFTDEQLMADARAVLDRLVPAEREVRSESGRSYVRRILPYRTQDRRIDGVVITFLDVTRLRDTERSLQASQEEYRLIFESVMEYAIYTADLDGTIRTWSPGAERILGFTERDAVGQHSRLIFTPEDRAAREAEKEIVTARETGRAADERWHVRKDGSRFWASEVMSALREPKTGRLRGLVKVLRDNTALKEAQDALRVSDERFRGLFEGVRDFAIFLLDKEATITAWNWGAENILGWTAAEAVGRPGAMIFTPEDRAAGAAEREIETARREGRSPDQRWHLRKDGSRFWANGVLTKLPGAAGGFVKIMRDETERKRTEEELAAVRQEAIAARALAEQANRTKDEFLATASHELRTPLSAILIWSKTLRRAVEGSELDRDAVAEAVGAIEHSAVAQKRLIEDLMDTVRIEAGKIRLDLREADLAKTVGAAVEAMRPAAAEKGVTLAADLAGDVGRARVDAGRIEQVVWNLISNAVKFTPTGGRVEVALRRDAEGAEIRVADNGVGIAGEHLKQIFERFTQVEGGLVRASGGRGLGLTIARQLVTLHGGTIEAESGGRNKGATFTVRLPGKKKKG